MSKTPRNKKYVQLDNVQVFYDHKDGLIKIVSKDSDIKGKPFQIVLNQNTPTENTLRNLLVEKGVVDPKVFDHLLLPSKLQGPPEQTPDWKKVPIGETFNNNIVYHDFNASPAVLVAGHAGGGKSVMMRNFLHHAFQHKDKFDVTGIDLTRVEFEPYNTIPNFTPVTTLKEALTTISLIRGEMLARYEVMKKAGVNHFQDLKTAGEPEYKVKLIVVEETYHLLALSGDTRSVEAVEEDATKQVIKKILNEIARLGRVAGIWVVLGTKWPTEEVFNGELKANLSTRILSGKSNTELSDLIFNDPLIGKEMSRILGRAVAMNVKVLKKDGEPVEQKSRFVHLQTFFTPIETIVKKYGTPTT